LLVDLLELYDTLIKTTTFGRVKLWSGTKSLH